MELSGTSELSVLTSASPSGASRQMLLGVCVCDIKVSPLSYNCISGRVLSTHEEGEVGHVHYKVACFKVDLL